MSENSQSSVENQTSTTPEQNKEIYRRFIQLAFNEGRIDLLDELLSPSYVYRDATPGTPDGKEAIAQVVTMFRDAFPDLHISFEDQVAEGDKVCSRTVTHGTHKGPIFGVEPTGKTIAMAGLTLIRIEDGRVAESWVKNDAMGLMKQLGATP